MLRILILTLVLTVSGAVGTSPADASSHGCGSGDFECGGEPSTTTDRERGAVVTDGVQFPGVAGDSRLGQATAENADCPECEWTISPSCVERDPGEQAGCLGALGVCSDPGDVRYWVYFRANADEPWRLIDTVCLGPEERPASVADVGELVRERVVTLLPDADPSFQPADGGIVNLPTIFAAGEPKTITTQPFDVLGFEVVVTAKARWEWTFDRGVTEEFDQPGGAYPDDSVTYTYVTTGQRRVSVTTYWTATFTVNGDGPFAVPGPEISKTAGPIQVPVREARSVLVGG